MSMILGSDYIDADNSFTTTLKTKGSKVYVMCHASVGISANTPAVVQFTGSDYTATALAAGLYGYIGVPEGGSAISAGCTGWIQIRGAVEDVQCSAAAAKGGVGESVAWTAATLYGSSSANQGREDIGQVGVFTAVANASTTISMYLTGMWATPK